jgi:SPP1 gp7 family putative phage head morphogenesis protein
VRGLGPTLTGPGDPKALEQALRDYAELLGPWAQAVARYMVADVERRNARTWKQVGQEMGRALRVELSQAPTGAVFTALMNEQVGLIKSIPLEAAQRVHDLTTLGLADSRRATEIAKAIQAQGQVSASRATLIARTEVARTASTLTQARARFAGSPGYIWRTSGDGDVRDTHAAMNGMYVSWDQPPKTDAGLAPYHAGCGPNCRCYPEPVLP